MWALDALLWSYLNAKQECYQLIQLLHINHDLRERMQELVRRNTITTCKQMSKTKQKHKTGVFESENRRTSEKQWKEGERLQAD